MTAPYQVLNAQGVAVEINSHMVMGRYNRAFHVSTMSPVYKSNRRRLVDG